MKITLRLSLALYTAFLIYCVSNFFYSPTGYTELKRLLKYKERLDSNLMQLKEINRNLSLQMDNLVTDPETLGLLSRELGFLQPREGIITIYGYKPRKNFFTIGTILSNRAEKREYSSLLGIISLAGGAFTFLISGFLRKRGYGIKEIRS